MKYRTLVLAAIKEKSESSLQPLIAAWLKDNPAKSSQDFKVFLAKEVSHYKQHFKRLKMVSVPVVGLDKERIKRPKKKAKADTLDKVVSYINSVFAKKKKRVEVSGDYRRGKKSVSTLAFIFNGTTTDEVYSWLDKHDKFRIKGTIAHGKKKLVLLVSVPKVKPFVIEFFLSSIKSWGAAQLLYTGSHEYVMYLKMLAKKKRLKLNHYGLWKGDKLVAGKSEEDILSKLKVDYLDPKDREITKMG